MSPQIVTIEDLQQFRVQLREDLKVLIQPTNNPSQREWLKSSDVRKMLGISHGTLQNLRIKGVLPYQKLGGISALEFALGTRVLLSRLTYNISDMTRRRIPKRETLLTRKVGERFNEQTYQNLLYIVERENSFFAVDATMRGPMIDLAGNPRGAHTYRNEYQPDHP